MLDIFLLVYQLFDSFLHVPLCSTSNLLDTRSIFEGLVFHLWHLTFFQSLVLLFLFFYYFFIFLFLLLLGFFCVVVGELVVINDVSSTKASPSLCITVLVGLVIIKLAYFIETDHRIVSRIVVQIQGAEPVH